MATHKSAEKAFAKSTTNKAKNLSVLNRVRTFITKVEKQITVRNSQEAGNAFKSAESEIKKAVSKGVLKLNNAARKISRLSKKVKSIQSK